MPLVNEALRTRTPFTLFGDGTVAAPSIAFLSDSDTGLYRSSEGVLGFAINGVAEMLLSASNLTPGANDGNALGSAAVSWADLFLASGAVINFANGDVTITHATDLLTLAGGIVDVTTEGLRVTGNPIETLTNTANTNARIYIAAGSNAGANDTQAILGFSRSSTDVFYMGVLGDAATVAGVAVANGDLKILNGAGTYFAVFDASDSNRLLLQGGVRLQGGLLFNGTTSGVVTLTVAAAAGTWTMQLPAAVGAAGQQLTDAGGDGITSWAAASLREWKHDLGILDPHKALDAVVSAPTHIFTFNKDAMPAGQWAPPDRMTGVFADEAPWAMHGERDGLRNGIAFSNINSFGYARAAIQALYEDLQAALEDIVGLKSQLAALTG